MDPLNGNAEHISARTAAVIHIKTIVIMYEDLNNIQVPAKELISAGYYHIAAGPPAKRPKKNADLYVKLSIACVSCIRQSYRTPPIKFKAQKLAAKLST